MRRLRWIAAALLPLAVHAQVYKWTDPQGRTQYGDKPPDETKAQSVKIEDTRGAVGTTDPDVQVLETEFVWFPVSGRTPYELYLSMRANGPLNMIAGTNVWGQTGWYMRWKIDYDTKAGGCRIGSFKVMLHSKQWLPRWGGYNDAASELRGKWDAFYRKLRIHEDGHKANGIKAANDLARRLRAVKPYPDCGNLQDEVSALGHRVRSEYALVDGAFDRVEKIYAEPLK